MGFPTGIPVGQSVGNSCDLWENFNKIMLVLDFRRNVPSENASENQNRLGKNNLKKCEKKQTYATLILPPGMGVGAGPTISMQVDCLIPAAFIA